MDCKIERTELQQTLSLVYNIDLLKIKRTENEIVWRFSDIFSHKINSVCPIAASTIVYLDLGLDLVLINLIIIN